MATTYILLKPSAREDAEHWQNKGAGVPHFYGKQVYAPESDEPRLQIHDDIMSPATPLPQIPAKFIKAVSYIGSIEAGFRCDGIYKHGRAVLEAHMDSHEGVRNQRITIRAPGIKSARAIYNQVRQGTLDPHQKWSEKPPEV